MALISLTVALERLSEMAEVVKTAEAAAVEIVNGINEGAREQIKSFVDRVYAGEKAQDLLKDLTSEQRRVVTAKVSPQAGSDVNEILNLRHQLEVLKDDPGVERGEVSTQTMAWINTRPELINPESYVTKSKLDIVDYLPGVLPPSVATPTEG